MSEQEQAIPTIPDITIGGIPVNFDQITSLPTESTAITSLTSRKRMSIIVYPYGYIEVKDLEQPDEYFFEADFFSGQGDDYLGPEDAYPPNLVYFRAFTVLRSGNLRLRHPDLRAGELVDASMQYFIKKFGSVNAMNFVWGGPNRGANRRTGARLDIPASDNYVEFYKVKNRLLKQYMDDGMEEIEARKRAQYEAIFSTWTGQRIAIPYGFTHVARISEADNKVTGKLIKPEFAEEQADE